ncbi:methyl-accepting chemotaxis protein [Neobacillus sp. D3-1R]|uniref:methyl-accepting chemotaxis protein n=1 Tax=Neobacillus sp. D3-1R TaxID=3445778 RepID=UPI003F9F7CBD
MKKSIITKLSWLVIIVTLISLTVISFANYQMTYNKVKEAAGLELIGCANITTGLLTKEDIDSLQSLSPTKAEELGRKINWTIEHKPIFENQYLLSLEGKVLVADESLQKQGIKAGDSFQVDPDILKTLMDEKKPVFSKVYTFGGMKRLTGYAPIFKEHHSNGEIIAISAIDFNAEILTERTWSMVSSTIIVGIISLLLAGTLIILYVRKTILPLRELTQYTQQIAEGDLSLKPQRLKASGEILLLHENFNLMVEKLKQALLQTSSTSKELAASTEELSVNTSEVTHIVEEVSTTFKSVAESANHQANDAEKIVLVFQQITEQMKRMTEKIQETAKDSNEVSSKALYGNDLIQESVKQMNQIQSSTTDIFHSMMELKEKSNKVHEILAIIMNISKQTNLLALNASIESARAGEHGKGFAVVAEEIRKLAEETSKSITNINQIINEMENKTIEAVELTEVGKNTVEVGLEKVQTAGTSFHEIKESTQKVSEEVTDIHSTIVHIQQEIDVANQQIFDITTISREISSQMQQVAASSEHQTASMEEISSSIQMLVHLANEMEDLSNQFKM